MQITIELDDDLAQEFFAMTPKDEQTSVIKSMFINYLNSKMATKTDDEVDFVGMWKDREMNVDEFVRQSRQGRYFNDH